MSNLYIIILVIAVFYLGMFFGFVLKVWLNSRASYNGVINVTRTDDKLIYSLELDDDPENLEFMDEVTFRVKKTSD